MIRVTWKKISTIENSPLIKPNIVEAEQSKQQTNTSETLDASSSNSPQPEIIDTEQMEENYYGECTYS